MAYTKTTWIDRIVLRARTYVHTLNGDGTVTLTDVPGEVTESGTPVNAANLNNLETGVSSAMRAARLYKYKNIGGGL